MRGNLGVPWHILSTYGSIPAYAGEPLVQLAVSLPLGVYPRVCGGTRIDRAQQYTAAGLSPRMRGNRNALPGYRYRLRSIPAYAGEPFRRRA